MSLVCIDCMGRKMLLKDASDIRVISREQVWRLLERYRVNTTSILGPNVLALREFIAANPGISVYHLTTEANRDRVLSEMQGDYALAAEQLYQGLFIEGTLTELKYDVAMSSDKGAVVVEKSSKYLAYISTLLTKDRNYTYVDLQSKSLAENKADEINSERVSTTSTDVFNKPESINSLAGKCFNDVKVCPTCGSNRCHLWDSNTVLLINKNTGQYSVGCTCTDCGTRFRLSADFTYELTKVSTRKI